MSSPPLNRFLVFPEVAVVSLVHVIEEYFSSALTVSNNNNIHNNMLLTRLNNNFFLQGGGGWAIFARKIFDSAGKNCYANLQNYFARLTPPGNW